MTEYRNYALLIKLLPDLPKTGIILVDNSDGLGVQILSQPEGLGLTMESLNRLYEENEQLIKDAEAQMQVDLRFNDSVAGAYIAYKQAGGTADKKGFLDLIDSMK